MGATVDLDKLKAIDVHTHVQASIHGGGFPEDSPEKAVAQVFGSDALLTVPELAAFYRKREMLAVCFMVDSVRWGGPVSNEEILELARERARRADPVRERRPAPRATRASSGRGG